MEFIKNFPFFSIMVAMLGAVVCSVLKGRAAKYVSFFATGVIFLLSLSTLVYTCVTESSFVYWMGHFPAPWGNEIRAGQTECMTATAFSFIILLIIVGGARYTERATDRSKQNYFYILTGLLTGALLALVYTNDLFTAYVFIEINTIAACGFIMIRRTGKSIASAIQYMTMSLLGSGLVLIGITLLYTITGHLLMENIHDSIKALGASGEYRVPLLVVIGLITVGLAIKSGLYPFHMWIPDAYSHSFPTSSALLSGLASKGYIFLLIKIYYRVIGVDSILGSHVLTIVFICGLIAMLMGSVHALGQNDIRRMCAFCSVSHIGYIFMCIGLGTEAGMSAALLHLYMHAFTKPMLFLAMAGIASVSPKHELSAEQKEEAKKDPLSLESQSGEGVFTATTIELDAFDSYKYKDIKGAGKRNPFAAFTFLVGSFSMVGIPLFAGFSSKLYIAMAATGTESGIKFWAVMLTLALSTILMVGYFFRVVIRLYQDSDLALVEKRNRPEYIFSLSLFIAANVFIGLFSGYIIQILESGIKMFG
ncbi:MAG: sodium:proton antiporter [Lachnospiraceae bacterium]|nr:sodium:proton antiporter [Lachnospiraceae bacterium]MBP5184675.1 sodium:proton antiporter [Lachnospiraceae bacterium]